MTPRPAPNPGERLLELFPIFAAFLVHALAHDRAVVAVPAMIFLVVAAARRWVVTNATLPLIGSGIVGAVIGAALLAVHEPPPGPVPPAVLSPVCGLLLALATYGALARSTLYATIYAWILAILSLSVPPTPELLAATGILAFGTLGSGIARARLLKADRASFGGAALFLALVVLGVGGIGIAVKASEGFLVRLVGGALSSMVHGENAGGIGLEEQLEISSHNSVERSPLPLFELSGTGPIRLRTHVFDRFDGWNWTSSTTILKGRYAFPERIPNAPEWRFQLTPLEPLGGVVPSPRGTIGVSGVRAWPIGAGLVRSEQKIADEAVTLDVTATFPSTLPTPDLTKLPDSLREELSPLAAEIVPATGTTRERAAAVETFFTSRFTYSLETNLIGKGHPLAVLIREKRPAYCIYFASAMASLLRASGIPARVVGGFVAEEQNPLTGNIIVRSRDAHAWVEAYLPEEGLWETYDPTPAASREEALGLGERTSLVVAAADAVFSFLRRGWKHFTRSPAEFLLHSKIMWALVVLGIAYLLRRQRWRTGARDPMAARRSSDAALVAAYAAYLAALRRVEIVPEAAETDDELLARIEARCGKPAREAAQRFVDGYREARFRGRSSGDLANDLRLFSDALRPAA